MEYLDRSLLTVIAETDGGLEEKDEEGLSLPPP
jgi:hypothetical protein